MLLCILPFLARLLLDCLISRDGKPPSSGSGVDMTVVAVVERFSPSTKKKKQQFDVDHCAWLTSTFKMGSQ